MTKFNPVLICGGVGTKMWPASRASMPKHFLPLFDDKSLFQINWDLLRKRFRAEEIFIQTNERQLEVARKQVGEIVSENVFLEPETKNTGPAIGLTCANLIKRGLGDEPFFLAQSDVLRTPDEEVYNMVDFLADMAMRTDKYITAGYHPDNIVAGVDYLVKGDLVEERDGVKLFEVADYIDRKEEEKIKQYMGTDKLLLHTCHVVMTPNNYLKMIKDWRDDWYEPLKNIVDGGNIGENFSRMPKGPQEEVAINMYKSGKALVAEETFTWTDFGTWDSMARYFGDKGQVGFEMEAGNSYYYLPKGKLVANIGVEDVIVVDSGDALLICKKGMSGKVGEVVEWLKGI